MSYEHSSDYFENERERKEREQLEHAQRVDREIHTLHASLPAHSRDIQLFTFAERLQWNLRRNARRSQPKADGA